MQTYDYVDAKRWTLPKVLERKRLVTLVTGLLDRRAEMETQVVRLYGWYQSGGVVKA